MDRLPTTPSPPGDRAAPSSGTLSTRSSRRLRALLAACVAGLFLLVGCGQGPRLDQRPPTLVQPAISYGDNATRLGGQVQFWVSGQNEHYVCTGTLISRWWVLTAKHCIVNTGANANTGYVYIGDLGRGRGERHDLARIVTNPTMDAALLELSTSTIAHADMVVRYGTRRLPTGSTATVRGWGVKRETNPNTPAPTLQLARYRVRPPTGALVGGTDMELDSVSGRLEPGDSGAGVMSPSSLLCGVHSSSGLTTGKSYAVSTNSIAFWIARSAGIAPSRLNTCDPGTTKKAVLRVFAVGDSITEGFNSRTGNGYRKFLRDGLTKLGNTVNFVGSHAAGSMVNPQNDGWSGQEIDFIRDKALSYLNRCDPKTCSPNVITLLAGTNDIGHGKASQAPQRLVSFIHQLRRKVPDAYIVVGDLLPDADTPTYRAHEKFNDELYQILSSPRETDNHVVQVDFSDLSTISEMNGLHPNDAGYQEMADEWGDVIEDLVSEGVIAQRSRISNIGPRHSGANPGVAEKPVGPAPGSAAMTALGRVADGGGPDPDKSFTQFADIDGNGRADYLWINAQGGTTMFANGGRSPKGGFVWLQRNTPIAGGIGAPGSQVRYADIDGDGKADYLTVNATGAVRAYFNGGPGRNDDWTWYPAPYPDQQIAGGIGAPGDTIQFGDLNGDGFDDYVSVDRHGAAVAYLNGGPNPDGKGWIWQRVVAQVASGVGAPRGSKYQFADINDDGWDDYIVFDGVNGSVHAWLNGGRTPQGGWNWKPLGQIAPGAGAPSKLNAPVLADLDADGKADYLAINPRGSVNGWLNNGKDTSRVAGWLPVGDLASASPDLRWADLNGDGLEDYIHVNLKTGAASAYLNGGRRPDGSWIWFPRGNIAGGECFLFKHCYVEFADINGDKKADYLVGDYTSGETAAWVNGGPANGGGITWYPQGTDQTGFTLAAGTVIQWSDLNNDGYADMTMTWPNGHTSALANLGPGAGSWTSDARLGPLGTISYGPSLEQGYVDRFKDFDNDGRADLLAVVEDGSVSLVPNRGSGQWFHAEAESTVTSGPGVPGKQVEFADLNGDGRADYLVVPTTGKVRAYLNNGGDGYQPAY